jgi:hypothetical protein
MFTEHVLLMIDNKMPVNILVCTPTTELSWMKKTVIVDVVFVNSVMWAEGWERGKD